MNEDNIQIAIVTDTGDTSEIEHTENYELIANPGYQDKYEG